MSAVLNVAKHPATNDGYAGSEHSPWIIVALVAALVEFSLLAAIFAYLHRTQAQQIRLQPMQIVLVPAAPQQQSKPKIRPAPQPQVQPPRHIPHPRIMRPRTIHKAAARPKIIPAPPPPPQAPAPQVVQPPPAPAPKLARPPPLMATKPAMPVVQPTPPKTASTPTRPAVDLDALRAAYGQAMHTAIQSAVRYPDMARRMGLSGKVLVAFIVQNGVAQNVHVATTSGSGILDRAALRAVRDATYPPLPAALKDSPLPLQLWIRFELDQGDDS